MISDISNVFSYQSAGNKTNAVLPDPFCDFASTSMPKTKTDVLRLCEHVWLSSSQFKTAVSRIVRYFLTDITFKGDVSEKEKRWYTEFLYDSLKIMDRLAEVGDDFMCYGNSFTSMYMPFNRVLTCKKCQLSRAINAIDDVKLDERTKLFKSHCPRCGVVTDQTHKDMRSNDETQMNIVRWNPHNIEINHDIISGSSEFLWKIQADQAKDLTTSKFLLSTLPWEFIEAYTSKGKFFQFDQDAVYHMKEPTIAGVENRGWGISRMLGLFKDVYYVQLLKRYNEALALDYIVPFRIISPAKAGAPDPMLHHDSSMWVQNLTQILAEHRHNPTGYHVAPFPVAYQALSGEGVAMSPVELIKQGVADMMDGIGVPMELYQGNMSMQAAPTALRLFESSWPQLVSALNGWLTWIVSHVSEFFGWEHASVELTPPGIADDIERRHILLQLAAGKRVSETSAFAPFGIDRKEEQKQIMQETADEISTQREFEEDQMKIDEMRQMAEPPPPQQQQPGMPPMQGAGVPMGDMMQGQPMSSPQEALNQAQQMAEQLMGMDETSRKSQLIQLKRSDPMMHAQVSQIMTDMRQSAATQGVAQMHQQMQQSPM